MLVSDGEHRSALAVVRSLGTAGTDVMVASAQPHAIARRSRHARAFASTPSPLIDAAGFVASLEELVRRWKIDAVIPLTDESTTALTAHLGASSARWLMPSAAAYRRAADKVGMARLARELRVQVPAGAEVSGPHANGASAVTLPVVVKPHASCVAAGRGLQKHAVRFAATNEELRDVVRQLPAAAFPVLVQERIYGPGVGVFLLRWDGKVRARFVHQRLREQPPAGGVSVYAESIAPSPEFVEPAERLLAALDWQGVAMVEFKLDSRSREPVLMEVNGRFWGSLQLAIDAGVNFPVLLLEAAFGAPPPPMPSYRVGVRSRWWWGEVDHVLARLRRSAAELHLPADAPGRWAAVATLLNPAALRHGNDVWQWGDPLPFLQETVNWLLRR